MQLSARSGALNDVATLLAGGRVVALSGAGMSTDSGIPDYRGPGSPPRRPMTFQEFLSTAGRQRYWARSFVGWQRMQRALPNAGHLALAALEWRGFVSSLVTQNVDGLHQEAGSVEVVDLHGRIDRVVCLTCGERTERSRYQSVLAGLNPGDHVLEVDVAPDGDAVLEDTARFRVADCDHCGGAIKPDVVFFGETVPPASVLTAAAMVDGADALLVLGSSLTVYSGRRFVHRAAQRGIPVVVVNRGPTRCDDVAAVRIDAGTSEVLTALLGRLTG